MPEYTAPTRDIMHALRVVGLADLAKYSPYSEVTDDLVLAIMEEAGRLGSQDLAPLNVQGDQKGCTLKNGHVTTFQDIKEFYIRYREGGWGTLPFPPAYGGQGLPWLVAAGVQEILQSANMAFALCPMLTQGAIDLLHAHGTTEQKNLYLPKMISGEWTGTMNLTEPQAGSDLSLVKTRAVPHGDYYLITGTKIFITYGDHDLAENIIHMVLARLPNSPEGAKGLSLFLVPKKIVQPDGHLGPYNDVVCTGLEHKLGIHASPTAVMTFGEQDGAIGWLVGKAHDGLACMFTMMNNARLTVGLQGYAVAERAYQHAARYARERLQSQSIKNPSQGPVVIIQHPDVQRMLMTMKARVHAARLLTFYAIMAYDRSLAEKDRATGTQHTARTSLLTPLVKIWGTDAGVEVTGIALQVFGGMGYIEETGAAQFYRDARIGPIYEGTNGIQAIDFVGRKVRKDQGAEMKRLINDLRCLTQKCSKDFHTPLTRALNSLETVTSWALSATLRDAYAGAYAYAHHAAITISATLSAFSAAHDCVHNDPLASKTYHTLSQHFIESTLPHVHAFEQTIQNGAKAFDVLPEEAF